jgi:hypothetical protein
LTPDGSPLDSGGAYLVQIYYDHTYEGSRSYGSYSGNKR